MHDAAVSTAPRSADLSHRSSAPEILATAFPVELLTGFLDGDGLHYATVDSGHLKVWFTCPPSFVALCRAAGGVGEDVVVDLVADGPLGVLMSFPLLETGLHPAPRRLLEVANEWNARYVFPRAALDADGDLRLDLVLSGGTGLSQDHVSEVCRCMMIGTLTHLDWLATCHEDCLVTPVRSRCAGVGPYL